MRNSMKEACPRAEGIICHLGSNLCIKETAALRLLVAVERDFPEPAAREVRMR